MKKTGPSLLAAAALGGLIAGTACDRQPPPADTPSVPAANPSTSGTNTPAPGTNALAGKLAPVKVPVVHDCAGDNDCKGIGGCKTDAHACKFKNDCKGKGGCHLTKEDITDWEKLQADQKAKAKT